MVSFRKTFVALASSLLFAATSYTNAQLCQVTVPPSPLSPTGLATAYTLNGCTMGGGTPTFVEGTIIDPVTGKVSVYNPLIIDAGTKPAVQPTTIAATFPVYGIVGLWFGTNGCTTTLVSSNLTPGQDSLLQGDCQNGGGNTWTIFGQFAACNARAFFAAANRAVLMGQLVPPPIGLDFTGGPCPTTRDFGLVDQDQSDNVVTKYLVTAAGTTAQWTPANVAQLAGATILFNGSDEALLSAFLLPAINCSVWKVPDLADTTGNQMVASLALNEIRASLTVPPTAYVPLNHAMVKNNGQLDLNKMNLYRALVNQLPTYPSTQLALTATNQPLQASLKAYCTNLYAVGSVKLASWLSKTLQATSPDPALTSLGAFLVNRYFTSIGPNNLNCSNVVPTVNGQIPLRNIVDVNGNIRFVLPAGQSVAQAIGASGYNANFDGEGQDPITVMKNAGIGSSSSSTGTTTTTANNNAFNPMWFGIGIAIGAAAILLLDLMFLCFKQSKSRSSSVNDALARV